MAWFKIALRLAMTELHVEDRGRMLSPSWVEQEEGELTLEELEDHRLPAWEESSE